MPKINISELAPPPHEAVLKATPQQVIDQLGGKAETLKALTKSPGKLAEKIHTAGGAHDVVSSIADTRGLATEHRGAIGSLGRNLRRLIAIKGSEVTPPSTSGQAASPATQPGANATPPPSASAPAAPTPDATHRVTGSADIPLSPDGHQQVAKEASGLSFPFNKVITGNDKRFMETAQKFHDSPEAKASLNGWGRGSVEGQPVDESHDEMKSLMSNPDKRPKGRSPISGEPGKTFNEFRRPLLRTAKEALRMVGPNKRILLVTSGGGLQLIGEWMKNGHPDSLEVNNDELIAHPYVSHVGKLFMVGDQGLKEVDDDQQPGLYVTEHGATAFNQGKESEQESGETEQAEEQGETEEDLAPGEHELASTQFNLPQELADKIRAFAANIPKEQLGEKGPELEPHVTVLYGLTDDTPDMVIKTLSGQQPISVTLDNGLSAFQNEDGDVLKIAVHSEELHDLHKLFAEHLGNKEPYPNYQPHVTIAYLKPGQAGRYADHEIDGVTGMSSELGVLTFSSSSGERTKIPLTGSDQPQSTSSPNPHAAITAAATPAEQAPPPTA